MAKEREDIVEETEDIKETTEKTTEEVDVVKDETEADSVGKSEIYGRIEAVENAVTALADTIKAHIVTVNLIIEEMKKGKQAGDFFKPSKNFQSDIVTYEDALYRDRGGNK